MKTNFIRFVVGFIVGSVLSVSFVVFCVFLGVFITNLAMTGFDFRYTFFSAATIFGILGVIRGVTKDLKDVDKL